ncbi:TetR/AcrR family transcriptional regulator [Nocardioides acrostichi]|uniref:TetR family transcriptional regulator n=1 Tax=Nocardioides acrostichi TaxID=2784339 RepID=A0A930V4S1_9ACTN|nr:TetR/AcrR family transcriptional regulator [Nocardioides acrostichi]MBF4163832.1 TetR family transcriptional regulator [Nocardioides acrostichi]
MPDSTPRERLREAAFALFEERGYEATTVGDIATAAGVGRTTFFRAFATKDDVVLPDHDELLGQVRTRLASLRSGRPTRATVDVALRDGSRIVLEHYLAEGELARTRYRLLRSVPALRDRELIVTARYQRVFREALRGWTNEQDGDDLRAELLGVAVTSAHNHVLRRWLRGSIDAAGAHAELERALDTAIPPARPDGATPGSAVVVLRHGAPVEEVLVAVRDSLDQLPDPGRDPG